MGTIDDMRSILTQPALDALCEKFHIPRTVHPELPSRNHRIHILEYFQINLSQLSVIAAAKIDSSAFPLSIPWHNNKTLKKTSHPTPTEFNAEVCDFLATHPALFRKFSESFLCLVGISRYYELDDNVYPVFFAHDDEEMYLFAFIRHTDPTKVRIGEREVREGEVPLLELTRGRVVPLPCVNDQGGANVQGVGRGVVNEESGDAALVDQIEESDHVAQDEGVNVVVDEDIEPTTVDKLKRIRKKRKVADGASGSGLPPKKLREDHGTSGNASASTGGKSLAAIQELFDRSTLAVEVEVTAATTFPFVTSSVTPTPERKGGGHTDSVSGADLRTRHPAERFVISSDSPHDSSANAVDDEVTSIVTPPKSGSSGMVTMGSSVSPPPLMIADIATSAIAGATSALVPGVGTEPVLRSIFRDSASPSTAEADVVGPSQPVGAEVCCSIVDQLAPSRERKKFEKRCTRLTGLLREKDVEVANLKAQLSLKEAEATEAIRLRGQRNSILEGEKRVAEEKVMTLESAAATKDVELSSLTAKTAQLTHDLSTLQTSFDDLTIKAASLESEKDGLIGQVSALETTCSGLRDQVLGYELFKEQYEVIQDAQVKALSDKVAGLDVDLMGMALHLNEEFYPRFLTTIAGRRWILGRGLRLVIMKCLQSSEYLAALGGAIDRAIDKGMQDGLAACIDHGKAGRDLVDVAAYNPSAEGNYVSAVNVLRAVDFPLLAQLESRKDASMADIMGLLHLEGPAAETPEASQLQPSPEQLILPIHRSEDQVRIRGDVASQRLSISDAMVPLIEPLSAKNLVGEASTSGVPAAVTASTALSTTFVQASSILAILVSDYQVLDVEPQPEVSPSSKIIFEQETLETSPEHLATG
ncbi:hypothetical protein Tco_0116310 [Tanacetum coccineum]